MAEKKVVSITANTGMESDKAKKLAAFCSSVNQKYGKGTVLNAEDRDIDRSIEIIPSGSISLDIALGIGGYPRGRIIEIFGQESSGKTTITLHAIAECLNIGKEYQAGFIDMEHALDLEYAKSLGVDSSRLTISQPDYGEQALEILEDMVRSNAFDICVIDSVAALVPKSELEGDMGDANVGIQARLMSQALRKITGATSKSKTCVIFINQLREKVGVMFGSPMVTTGGNALKFYASQRLEISKAGQNKEGDEVLGNKTKVKVVKNKMAPPFKTALFDIEFGVGISKMGEIVDIGSAMGIINKSGSWFSYSDTKLGQGREAVISILKDNPELSSELETQIKIKSGLIKL